MTIHVFGIRHHGPGCARSLRAALDELQPDAIAMEGPTDGAEALALAGHAGLKPPVAMLLYAPDEPRRAVCYPLTTFSPEWQTLRWAVERNVPVRLMDLPQTIQLAMHRAAETAADAPVEPQATNGEPHGELPGEAPGDSPSGANEAENLQPAASDVPEEPPGEGDESPTWRADPLAHLAEAAGYRDHELWWEEQIERRRDAAGLFDAILDAMRAVRDEFPESSPRDLLREAFMRQTIRGLVRGGLYQKIAVVCGAWHAPVLDEETVAGKREGLKAKDDEARLKGLPKLKTTATWIPWTHSRLSYDSGYGAGVQSPGWYAHLWESGSRAPLRWIATAARLLREKDLDASSASVIEAIRLADALAAIRELRSPGLAELNEAILTVLCHGQDSPMRLIHRKLEVGDVLGEAPDEAAATPLARDLAEQQKSLRLKPSAEIRTLDLDLRKETDLAKSRLFHRLNLLEIPWAVLQGSGSRTSTFHEIWRVEWKPEFAVAIIEANVWGGSVVAAALAKVVSDAGQAQELAQITELLDASILAGLDAAVDPLLARIQSQAAVSSDVRSLLDALLPLARIARYGDVRRTEARQVLPILVGLFERGLVGLGAACAALDDEAANRMLATLRRTQEALELIDVEELTERWRDRLRSLMNAGIHGLLRGGSCRLLLEKGALDDDVLYRAARLALSPANPPAECAAWATGLLRGSGLLLLHQDEVWKVFDRWLVELSEETFVEMLPLLRRAFADFQPAERRQMGEKVKHLRSFTGSQGTGASAASPSSDIDLARASRVLPTLAHILGVPFHDA